MADPRLAMPGDPDLDCHLFGLRLKEIVALPGEDYDAEVTITYDITEASGFWTDAATGQRVIPDRVTTLTTTFGLRMLPGFDFMVEDMISRLEAWQRDRSVVALTAAPGKWTVLHCPEHPAGSLVVWPRGDLQSGEGEGKADG